MWNTCNYSENGIRWQSVRARAAEWRKITAGIEKKKKKKARGWKVNCMSHVFLRGWFSNRLVVSFVFCVFLFRPPSEFLLREGRLTSERKEATEGEDTLLAVRDCSFSLRWAGNFSAPPWEAPAWHSEPSAVKQKERSTMEAVWGWRLKKQKMIKKTKRTKHTERHNANGFQGATLSRHFFF